MLLPPTSGKKHFSFPVIVASRATFISDRFANIQLQGKHSKLNGDKPEEPRKEARI